MTDKVTPFPGPRHNPGIAAALETALAAIIPPQPGAAYVSVPAQLWELMSSDVATLVKACYSQGLSDGLSGTMTR